MSLGEPGTDEIVVGEIQDDLAGESMRPLTLNVRTGVRRSLLKEELDNAINFLFDQRGHVRLAITRKQNIIGYHWLDLDTQK